MKETKKEPYKGCFTKGFYTLEKNRHSLEKSGYADFFLFLGQFDCSDEVPMNEDGLFFRSGTRHLLRLEHIDTLYQGSDNLRIQFLDLGVLLDLCKEGIDVEPLRLGFGEGLTQHDHPCLKVFLLLFVGSGHLCETFIADLAIEVILIKPLNDAVQFGDALCGLFQFPAAFTELPIEVTLIFLGKQFHKFRLSFTHKGKHPVYLRQQNLLHLHIKELVRGSVEETLNELLEQETEKLTQAARYERSEARQGYRSGHYDRNLTTTSGDVTLHVPRLKGISFETAIIERYRRRESSVEEALIEMYLAGVSVRRVEDITEALWGSKVSPATISELNKKAYVHIEDWRNRPLQGGKYPYVYVDGIYLRRNWGGEYENVAILVAIAVNEDGYREVLGAAEGMKEDKASWVNFFQWLKSRGLDGVKLIVGDKCLGMLEAVGEVFPDAKYQRCTVHFYRNVFSVVPRSKVKLVAKMLKAIHAQESKKASREKAKAVADQLREMKLKEAAKNVEDSVEETLTYCEFPYEHWTRIRTNNVIERLNREIRRRTRVVGTFPDGNSALMLVCARLRHVAGTQWGNKKYMNMKHLEAALEDVSIAG